MRQDDPSCCPAGWQTLWSPTTSAHTGVLKYQTTIQVYTIPIQVYLIPESSSYGPMPPQPLQLTVTHKAVSNNCITARWYRGETDNQETTPVGYCPSMASFSVRPYCKNARRDRCQKYHNCFPFEGLGETTRTSSNYVVKTIQQDLRSNNLSLDEAITVAQNGPLWRLMSAFGAMHP